MRRRPGDPGARPKRESSLERPDRPGASRPESWEVPPHRAGIRGHLGIGHPQDGRCLAAGQYSGAMAEALPPGMGAPVHGDDRTAVPPDEARLAGVEFPEPDTGAEPRGMASMSISPGCSTPNCSRTRSGKVGRRVTSRPLPRPAKCRALRGLPRGWACPPRNNRCSARPSRGTWMSQGPSQLPG